MKFATTVTTGNKVPWATSIIILGATVLSDVYDHLSVIRHVPFIFKLMLILQSLIAIYICMLNAFITAGQAHALDILMKASALLVLNDMDNVIGAFFALIHDLE